MNSGDEPIILTDGGKKVLCYMQEHGGIFVGKELSEQMGMKNIYFVLHSLICNGLVEYDMPVRKPFVTKGGKIIDKDYKTYKLTEAGEKFGK